LALQRGLAIADRKTPRHSRAKTHLWFLIPALLPYAVFFMLPTAAAFYLGLFDWNGLTPARHFIGMANFVEILHDSRFVRAALHNAYIFLFLFVFQNTVSLGLAVLLDHRTRMTNFYRTVIFLPVVLSPVATGFIWEILLSPNIGLVNPALAAVGMGFLRHEWLADPHLALPVTTLALAWQWNGLATVLLLAGLQNVPPDLRDAARVDGAREWRVFRHITIPHLAPAFTVLTVLLCIMAFRAFDLIYVLGGPTGAPDGATSVLATHIYTDAFGYGIGGGGTAGGDSRFGYASAEGAVMFVFLAAVSAVLLTSLSRRERRVY